MDTRLTSFDAAADSLRSAWRNDKRWTGIRRAYDAEAVVRLRGSVHIEHTLARLGAEKLWQRMHDLPFVNALGALTGNQAMQQVKAGLPAIYLSARIKAKSCKEISYSFRHLEPLVRFLIQPEFVHP